MALKLPNQAQAYGGSRRQGTIVGTWALQESGPHLSTSLDRRRHRLHKGEFRARQKLTHQRSSWLVELLDGDPRRQSQSEADKEGLTAELSNLRGLISRYSSSQPDSGPMAPSSGFQVQTVMGPEHGELMSALKKGLEARYGQVEELHVLFQRLEALPPPWQRQEDEPWWRRLQRRLGRIYVRGPERTAAPTNASRTAVR